MKKLALLVLLCLSFFEGFSQATQLATAQATVQPISAPNIVWIDKTPGQLNRIYVANVDSLKLKVYQLPWILDSVTNWGDSRYAKLLGAYTDPAFVNSLSAGKVFGLSAVALSGDYLDLTNRPNTALFYLASNPSGYISGITSGMVNAAYGYVPYDASNPSGFITSSSLTPYLLIADTTNKWVPSSRTLTINGSTQDLSSNRTWSVGTLVGTDTLSLSNRINGKLTIPTGTTSQYLDGVGAPTTISITGGKNTSVTGSLPNITIADSLTNRYYNSSGIINQNIKVWTGMVTPSTSSGYSINISSAGFSTILSVQLSAFENVATEKGVLISGKTTSTSAIVVNLYRSKLTGVLIGGNVEGLEFHPTPANVTVSITVIGY